MQTREELKHKYYCHFQITCKLDQEETQTNQACKENITAELTQIKFQKPQKNMRQYASILNKQIHTQRVFGFMMTLHRHTPGFTHKA